MTVSEFAIRHAVDYPGHIVEESIELPAYCKTCGDKLSPAWNLQVDRRTVE